MLPIAIEFGREICGDLAAAEAREWLVTNGLGGFAMGTVAGTPTRRYHGLLVAALDPPRRRTLLVTKLDEIADCDGASYSLGANRWQGGALDPEGYRFIERFHLDGTTPVWTFALADALLEKRIWMEQGENTTYVRYRLLRASGALTLTLKALVNYRGFHAATHAGDWRMAIQPVAHGVSVNAFSGAHLFFLLSAEATAEPAHEWYRNFELSAERERGLDDCEDHLHAATFRAPLEPRKSLTLVFSTEPNARLDGDASFARRQSYEQSLLDDWQKAKPEAAQSAPGWIRQLVLAADQFVVRRPAAHPTGGRSVIAGYPWFGEWGRDTMVALPGLALATGRPEIARGVLRTFFQFVDRGLLPNMIPEEGDAALYNSVDAALWAIEAVRQYFDATHDIEFVREVFPVLAGIVAAYSRGTRFNIRADPKDGLLSAGEPGVQLTWMDAKVGNWLVTPRMGKPVEVNALWVQALATVSDLSVVVGGPSRNFSPLGALARQHFARFWNPARGCCFDVVDGPAGDDPSLRPNQIVAASLADSGLSLTQRRAIVAVCAKRLLTSFGLRSLAPEESGYCGHYGGPQYERDAAYHQGTAWGWLLGPFALAHFRAYGDRKRALSFLEPMADHLRIAGLGTASEIFDGDPPFAARGCIAQAWTAGEILRAWTELHSSSNY